jgi:hypothetical protein
MQVPNPTCPSLTLRSGYFGHGRFDRGGCRTSLIQNLADRSDTTPASSLAAEMPMNLARRARRVWSIQGGAHLLVA